MVYDLLYGLDANFQPHPQMVEGHKVDNDGLVWELTLRDGLRFHDGEKVLARDCVACILRWGKRDAFGSAMMSRTAEMAARSDRVIRIRLKKPFALVPVALAQPNCVIMPERIAKTDANAQIDDPTGSGPFRFLSDERIQGSRSVYAKFDGYVPRSEGTTSFLAGPRIVHFDRVVWTFQPDPATSAAALSKGEFDWWENPPIDLVGMLRANKDLTVDVKNRMGAIGCIRFNHLYPPFDNPAIRRALLGAVDQAAAMQAVAGSDPALWRDRIGLFDPGAPLGNDAGIEVLEGPRDYAKVRRELTAAGYHGEPIVVLDPTDVSGAHALALVGADQLRQSGMDVDVQSMDAGTMFRRRDSKQPIRQGGWNVFFTFMDSTSNFTPFGNPALSGNGVDGWAGWPTSPRIEELRQAWLDASDLEAEKRICRELQLQLWQDVPYIPMGQCVQQTCYRRTLTDVPKGPPLFFGVRPA